MSAPFRICRTHSESLIVEALGRCFPKVEHVVDGECDIIEMVWSADGAALLVVTECERCEQGVLREGATHGQCPSCGGSGLTYQAETFWRDRPINEFTDERICWDEHEGEGCGVVAVVAVPEREPA